MGTKSKAKPVDLGLELGLGPDTDERELEELTRQFREELLELDVASVDLVAAGTAPVSAKGFGLVAAGGLVVKLLSGQSLGKVVDVVKAWLARDSGRTAKLVVGGNVIELAGLTAAQQEKLIEAWIRQAAGGGR